MQISTGWAKGLKLAVPAGEATRPTRAKVRAALLNSLQGDLADVMILDVFAGSGALGIEAVSRGARGATFIEKAAGALKSLSANLDELKRRAAKQDLPPPELEVIGRDVLVALAFLEKKLVRFDIIVMDPPYKDIPDILQEIAPSLARLAQPHALLAVESAAASAAAISEMMAAAALQPWVLMKQKKYGDTMISILQLGP